MSKSVIRAVSEVGIRLFLIEKDLNTVIEQIQSDKYTKDELINALTNIKKELFIEEE